MSIGVDDAAPALAGLVVMRVSDKATACWEVSGNMSACSYLSERCSRLSEATQIACVRTMQRIIADNKKPASISAGGFFCQVK